MGRPLIVVTDNDQTLLDILTKILDEAGYDTLTVIKADNAFALIKARQPRSVFIELLIRNPEAGLMMVNQMRLDPATTAIPIIIALTTTRLLHDNAAHLRANGCDLFPKPFDLEAMPAIAHNHWRPHHRSAHGYYGPSGSVPAIRLRTTRCCAI